MAPSQDGPLSKRTAGCVCLSSVFAVLLLFAGLFTYQQQNAGKNSIRGNQWTFFFDETIDAGTGLLVIDDNLNSERSLLERFRTWARGHGKVYASPQEETRRLNIFAQSLRMIMEHKTNKPDAKYELGLTYFADWTEEEFFATMNFPKKRECWGVSDREKFANAVKSEASPVEASALALPRSVDWRKTGVVTPVKNQGRCGSCWAFAAIGALEAQYAKKHHRQLIFSEQQLLDCSYGFGNFGCNGGFPARAFEYIRLNGGLNKNEDYPYEMVSNSSCRANHEEFLLKVKRVVNVTEADEHALERAVAFGGPVTVAFVVANDFRLYSGGIYTTKDCGSPKPQDLTHAVLAVGYDVSSDGTKYWIVKNSWSERWGLGGYFLMERGKNMCGIADCASYAEIE